MLRDARALPVAFREDVHTLFAARKPGHPQHLEIYGLEEAHDRPHRFWTWYNSLLVRHGITEHMVVEAAAEERASRGALLRDGVGDLLAMCEAKGVLVVVLSAGLEQVIRAACAQDGVEMPATTLVLTNSLIFDVMGRCVAVEPTAPPASREGKLLLLGACDSLQSKDLVLMIGDKPVDARVARGLPALKGGSQPARTFLSYGFLNTEREPSTLPPNLEEWQAAFDILARQGDACNFAPLVTLVRELLDWTPG